MRPVRLEMRGFGSFHDKAEIDFSGVGLAALVGNTGAGKSTVIDGITFALYGRVARHPGDQVAPIINQKAQEARVLLRFEAGGVGYTAVRTARLAADGSGAKTREARLERDDGQVLAGRASEMAKETERLLGLSFEQFTKTVVLPQGQFARFLHDTPGDRQKALSQLLDLGMYTQMGEQARRTAAAADAARAECDHQAAAATTAQEAARLELHASQTQQAATQTTAAVADLHTARAQTENASEHAQRVQQQAACLRRVEIPGEALASASETAAARAASDEAEATAEAAAESERRAREALAEGPDLNHCRRVLQDHDTLEVLRGDADNTETAETEAQDAEAHAQALAADVAHTADAAALAARSDDRAAAEAADRSEQATAQRARIERLRGLYRQVSDIDRNSDAATAALREARKTETTAQAALRNARDGADRSTEALDEKALRHSAYILASGLSPGDDCPVCGNQLDDMPHEPAPADLAAAQTTDRAAKAALNAADSDARLAADAAAKSAASLEFRADQRVRVQAELDGAETQEQLDALEQNLDQAVASAKLTRTAAQQTAEQARAASALAANAAAAHADAKSALSSAAARADAARSQRDRLAGALGPGPTRQQAADDEQAAAVLAQQHQDARRSSDEASSAAESARRRLADALKAEDAARAAYTAARDSVAGLSPPPPVGELLADWRGINVWAAAKADEMDADHDDARRAVRAAQAAANAAHERAVSICGALVDLPPEPHQWPAVMASAAAEARAASDAAAASVKAGKQARSRSRRLAAEHRAAEMLGRLLRKDGFPRWLMEAAAASLAQDATLRLLELSEGRFSLVVSGGEFKILDHFNANEERDAKSLSGGETFLASLALALSLAERQSAAASATAPGLGSLFIDEGFGTLDLETLDTAASAIEALGASGRMVCVVTHIREFADRMPVRFEVSRNSDTSSVRRLDD